MKRFPWLHRKFLDARTVEFHTKKKTKKTRTLIFLSPNPCCRVICIETVKKKRKLKKKKNVAIIRGLIGGHYIWRNVECAY